MLRLETIRDADVVRQIAVLLERENDRLHAKLHTLTRELSQLRGDDASAAQRQLAALKEILAHREQALFGASSEKRPQPLASAPAPAAPPPRGHGPKAQPALPIIDMVHELAASDRTCTACGGVLREMAGQTEDSEEITVVERRLLASRRELSNLTAEARLAYICAECAQTGAAAQCLAATRVERARIAAHASAEARRDHATDETMMPSLTRRLLVRQSRSGRDL